MKHGHGCKILEAGDVAGAYVEDWKGEDFMAMVIGRLYQLG